MCSFDNGRRWIAKQAMADGFDPRMIGAECGGNDAAFRIGQAVLLTKARRKKMGGASEAGGLLSLTPPRWLTNGEDVNRATHHGAGKSAW